MPQPDRPELLAPAGDMDALHAAIEAGANAVYLGLQTLNARRGARNFSPEELPQVVAEAHARGVKIYLTLNIDVTQRELGQAVRMLQLAQNAQVDAVLVRDPAIILLRRFFPMLQFHFSTQSCIANSADVLAAGELGASRAVLARELSLAEIAACAKAGAVETEVFVQGALCFCVSGRCMLSSWAGGRSGNRGTCTSPCRVPWSADQRAIGTPLSMKDLTAIGHLSELAAAGVKSLKIEGRLKSAKWVSQAVGLFARGFAGDTPEHLMTLAQELGAYTGRQLTSGYLTSSRDELVAQAVGRVSSSGPLAGKSTPERGKAEPEAAEAPYEMSIDVTDAGIVCTCRIDDRSTSWTLPKTVVHRQHRAITIANTLDWLTKVPIRNHRLKTHTTNNPEFMLVPRATNALPDQISAAIRQLEKTEDETLRLDIPDELRAVLAKPQRHIANARSLGDAPDRVRLEARHVAEFVRRVKACGRPAAMPSAIIVEQLAADQVDHLLQSAGGVPVIVALPSVFFEGDIPAIQQLVTRCVTANVTLEVNSWGGMKPARDGGARYEAGPAMGVLNALAAKMLHQHGCQSVSLSIEADRKQMEDIAAICPAPLSVTVFGRPALMITRVKMPKDQIQGKTLEDRRNIQLRARLEHGLWTLRPIIPFDLRPLKNQAIRAAHLVVDLVASPAPAEEWLNPSREGERSTRFNYGRTLA
jgi:putative protease